MIHGFPRRSRLRHLTGTCAKSFSAFVEVGEREGIDEMRPSIAKSPPNPTTSDPTPVGGNHCCVRQDVSGGSPFHERKNERVHGTFDRRKDQTYWDVSYVQALISETDRITIEAFGMPISSTDLVATNTL